MQECLIQHSLIVCPEKCSFDLTEIDFLGHISSLLIVLLISSQVSFHLGHQPFVMSWHCVPVVHPDFVFNTPPHCQLPSKQMRLLICKTSQPSL
jgi:hypothetical protein